MIHKSTRSALTLNVIHVFLGQANLNIELRLRKRERERETERERQRDRVDKQLSIFF